MTLWLFASLLAHAGDLDGTWSSQATPVDPPQEGCTQRRLWQIRDGKVRLGLEARCEAPGVLETCEVWLEPIATLSDTQLNIQSEALVLGQLQTHRSETKQQRGDTLSRSASSSQQCVLHARMGLWDLEPDGTALVLTGKDGAPTWSLTRESR